MSEVKQDQQQQEGAGKVRKKYEQDLAQLTQVIGGTLLFKPSKLIPSEVETAIKEMAHEEKERLIKEFKDGAINAIKKQREHLKVVAQLKKDFQKKEEESMKEFSKTVDGLFKMLENIKGIEKNYYDILMGYTPSDKPEEEQDEDTNKA